MKFEVHKVEKINEDDYLFTIRIPKRYGFLWLKVKDTFSKVRGRCTVWHWSPSGQRCDLSMEISLANYWRRMKWEDKNNE